MLYSERTSCIEELAQLINAVTYDWYLMRC